ncbi:MAG TPA: gephyrin-like molybdotransferase Glp [Verrucomicrobiae bacterium]|jgi:molybdopterin molybdotransferase|nr:gephyrin-like molybdotransferase Glp [Verrucomicrobiae bacterium]
MLSLEEAVAKIVAATKPLPAQTIPLAQATGLGCAENIYAPISLPPFDNSSMDGYAVRAADLEKATAEKPVILRIKGILPAGVAATDEWESGSCVRIFTGSMLPPRADAVVMQEDVKTNPADLQSAIFTEPVEPWENVRLCGDDVKQSDLLAAPQMQFTPQRLALLGAAGVATVKAYPAPRLGLLATGDELREPGETLAPGQIHESNRLMLASLAKRSGATATIYPIVPDDLAATQAALEKAFAECDAVVTTGGVSVGELDFVKAAFEKIGGALAFWKVSIKPGKPFVFGEWNGKFLFGLPGNPVSAFVTFYLLVRPALQIMRGNPNPKPPAVPGKLAEALINDGDRRHFMRVTMDQAREIRLAGPQASHRLGSLAAANGLIDVPPHTTLPAGAQVSFLHW